jgi:hypothetical protein
METKAKPVSLKDKALDVYACKENVMHYMIKSGGSVEFSPKRASSSQ